jgi:hypothetical protein
MPKPIDALLQKEMSRKEFLMMLGFGLASVMGFSTILRLLTGKSLDRNHAVSGYGSSSYGGATNNRGDKNGSTTNTRS